MIGQGVFWGKREVSSGLCHQPKQGFSWVTLGKSFSLSESQLIHL